NTLCPYGFWGLKHYIEQPINREPTQDDGSAGIRPDVLTEIKVGPVIDLAVAVTRDSLLDTASIARHLLKIGEVAPFIPHDGADDWPKVCDMLKSPEIAYFLCHGEYDDTRKEPYLGVGLRDGQPTHRVYPEGLI